MKKLTIILYLILISLILSIIFIYYFQKQLGNSLITCAENNVKEITTIVINNGIKKYQHISNINNILNQEKNNQGEITHIEYNTKIINEEKQKITDILEKDLQLMIKGDFQKLDLKNITDIYYEKINNGIIFSIPIGTATGNLLLSNLGPKIPLKLKLVGEINTNIKTNIKEYGLNNALIEIYLETKTTTVIQMPFLSKKITIKNNIPLTMEIIQGYIPGYMLTEQHKS